MNGVLRLRETIVRKFPFARRVDESHSAQIGQMTRHCGLWQAENVDDIADAELPCGENAENPDAGRISEALEDRIEIIDRRNGEFSCYWCQLLSGIIFANTSIMCEGEYDPSTLGYAGLPFSG